MHILAVHVYAYVGVSAERATMMGTVEEALRKGRGLQRNTATRLLGMEGGGNSRMGWGNGRRIQQQQQQKTLLENATMKPVCAN